MSFADLVANTTAVLSVYLIARQPKRHDRKRIPRWVVWPMLLAIPFLLGALLSPEVMEQAISLKRSLFEPGTLPLDRLDHLTHGVMAFVISVAVFTFWPAASRKPRRTAAVALLLMLGSGPVVEILQNLSLIHI